MTTFPQEIIAKNLFRILTHRNTVIYQIKEAEKKESLTERLTKC